ncbi:MAG: hypothetical protein J3K34DRAFT_475540 [Monoraphidium minutum]|nr:MAG: hypothetical protein J3K34DRAFT_475540 [Monoraphidium minutum]
MEVRMVSTTSSRAAMEDGGGGGAGADDPGTMMNGPADIDGLEAAALPAGSDSDGSRGAAPGGAADACPDGGELTAAAITRCAGAVRQAPAAFDLPCTPPLPPLGAAPAGGLRQDARLAAAAQVHADALAAAGGAPSTTGVGGSTPMARITGAGFPDKKVAEASASGKRSAKEVVFGWVCAPEQRDSIMGCALDSVGAGVARSKDGTPYVVLDTGCSGDAGACTC